MLTAALAVPASGWGAAANPVAAATTKISTADFAALPLLTRPRLSPDGRKLVARSTHQGKARLVILDAERPQTVIRSIALGKASIASVRWAGSQRLLLTILSTGRLASGEEIPFLRLIAVDTDTGQSRLVDGKSRGVYAGDVLYADPTGSWALVASQDDLFSYPSVKRIDLATGNAMQVEKPRQDVWDWYADDQGVVRAGVATEGRRWTVWYREAAGQPLRAIHGKTPKDDDSTVDRFIFGRGENGWIMTNERTGRFAVYKYDFKTSQIGAPLFEHATNDVDDVTYDPATGEISAIEYHDDRPRTVWLDAELKGLQAKVDKALPDAVNTLVDWSQDRNRVLVWSGGAADPGQFLLLDRKTLKMHPVLEPYGQIDPQRLSPVAAVSYRARDGLNLPAYLTLPRDRPAAGLPLIVLPHGGPFARDEWTYDPLVQFLANRGYAVLQPQFRGSTGYGKEFVARGYGEYGRKMQDDLDDGVDWLTRSGKVDPKRVCIAGMSYGGYAAMWGAIRNPERYRCAASWAGVSDLRAQLRYDRKSFAAARYFREWRTRVAGEGKADLAAVSPVSFADRVRVPLFIAHGEADETVPVKQSRAMIEALQKAGKDVTAAFYKDSGHDFGSAADLDDFLRRLEAFLARHNPA
ncbi:MAG TPA: S9 family peptidase [Sphingomicrobium sp.]|nr:S9 family peptidase [Sphingomicrobium sp.]